MADSGLGAQNTGMKSLSLGLISVGGRRRQVHEQVWEEGFQEGEQQEAGSFCADVFSVQGFLSQSAWPAVRLVVTVFDT